MSCGAMTIDTTELKTAAEACDVNKCADEAEWDRRFSEFLSECDPDVTLALLAEIERLKADNRSLRGSCAKTGSENAGLSRQLKKATRQSADARAELAGLRTGYDAQNNVIADLKAENEALRLPLQYLIDNEDNHDENQAERHMVITDAQCVLAAMAKEASHG